MRRCVLKVPPEAAGGAKFVLAISPPGVDASRAAQDGNSLLLRLQSEAEVCATLGSWPMHRQQLTRPPASCVATLWQCCS